MNVADTLRRLPPAVLDAALAGCVEDLLRLAFHALRNPTDIPPCATVDRFVDALIERTLPPLWTTDRLASWTLYVLGWHASYRPLTDDERATQAAAQRLWDALEGVPLGPTR